MEISDFKVEVVTIDDIIPHPNADKLLIAKVKGWQNIIPKDKFSIGEKVIYIPVDSVFGDPLLEGKLFPPESKIKLVNSRVRAIKIRQFISQGMIEKWQTFFPTWEDSDLAIGDNVASYLTITKYEPPVPAFQGLGQFSPASKKKTNPHFAVYTKFPRIQNYPTMFDPEDEVVVTEKIHGTNFRAGWVPFVATTWWRKVQRFLGLAPKWQFVYGSHYTQLSDKLLYNGYYSTNVYAEIVYNYCLKTAIPKGHVVYGEIYGAGIQKGYNYGLDTARCLVVFDIQKDGKYLGWDDFQEALNKFWLPTTAVLFKGKFKDCNLEQLCAGPSILDPSTLVREGCVVKPVVEGDLLPRKGAKVINPLYLIGDNTDYH